MHRIRTRAWQLAMAVPILLAARSDTAAQGCAMCRTALGGADDPLAEGFYWSVLCLMAAPYTVAAAVGGWLVYRHVVAAKAAPDEPAEGQVIRGSERGGAS